MDRTDRHSISSQWNWGCLGALAIALALLLLGWERFGRLSIFLILASVFVRALHIEAFEWALTEKRVSRDRHPFGYWLLIGICAAIALSALWLFLASLRQGAV
jgi:hypothetical protein